MNPSLHTGRRVLVTGAANGIGRASALRFLAEGARVAAVDVEAPALAALEKEAGAPDRLLCLEGDVSNEASIAGAVEKAVSAWGGLDTVMANAAIEPHQQDTYIHELDAALLRRVVDVNLIGLVLTCKHGLRALLQTGQGSIVITGSTTGFRGIGPEEGAYSVSKSGAIGLMRVIAAGYADKGIRANAVIPGMIDTRVNRPFLEDPVRRAKSTARIPLGRAGKAEEIAAVAVFLASDEASYVTGAVWMADGGRAAV